MTYPHVRGDNPRALASGLFLVHLDNHDQFYTTYITIDFAHYELLCSKVGKGGIRS